MWDKEKIDVYVMLNYIFELFYIKNMINLGWMMFYRKCSILFISIEVCGFKGCY